MPGPGSSWPEISEASRRLALDAASVVWLRSLRLTAGGEPARRELALMVAEKWYGNAGYVRALASGRLGRSAMEITAGTIAYYGLWLRHNRQRLSHPE